MTTGDRMKARRKELKLSAEDVAAALNVSRATIFRYEKGDIEKLPGTALEPLAKVLQTTVAYLMGWSAESSPAGVTPSSANLVTIHYAGPVAAHFNATPDRRLRAAHHPCRVDRAAQNLQVSFLATVSGDSMYPQFQDGDEILCLRCSDMGVPGRIGIMLLGRRRRPLSSVSNISQARIGLISFPSTQNSSQGTSKVLIWNSAALLGVLLKSSAP